LQFFVRVADRAFDRRPADGPARSDLDLSGSYVDRAGWLRGADSDMACFVLDEEILAGLIGGVCRIGARRFGNERKSEAKDKCEYRESAPKRHCNRSKETQQGNASVDRNDGLQVKYIADNRKIFK